MAASTTDRCCEVKNDVISQKKPGRQKRHLSTIPHSTEVELFLSVKICQSSLVRKPKAKGVICGFKSIFWKNVRTEILLKRFSKHAVFTLITALNES